VPRKIRVRLLATGLAVICLIVGYVVGVVVKERSTEKSRLDADGPYNALFNVSKEGELGFWIYSVHGNCPDLRVRDQNPLVMIASPAFSGQGRVELPQLSTCIEVRVQDDFRAQVITCAEAVIDVKATSDTREKTGSYSVKLTDGRQRSGKFHGVQCAPKPPPSTR